MMRTRTLALAAVPMLRLTACAGEPETPDVLGVVEEDGTRLFINEGLTEAVLPVGLAGTVQWDEDSSCWLFEDDAGTQSAIIWFPGAETMAGDASDGGAQPGVRTASGQEILDGATFTADSAEGFGGEPRSLTDFGGLDGLCGSEVTDALLTS